MYKRSNEGRRDRDLALGHSFMAYLYFAIDPLYFIFDELIRFHDMALSLVDE